MEMRGNTEIYRLVRIICHGTGIIQVLCVIDSFQRSANNIHKKVVVFMMR